MKLRTLSLSFCLLLVGVTGCATPSEKEVKEAVQKEVPTDTPDQWANLATADPVQVGWIDSFHDKELTALVYKAQENNRDIRAAAAGVEKARAFADKAGAGLFPTVNAGFDAAKSGNQNSSASSFGLGLSINWELDVWGRVRAGQQGAAYDALAAEADFKYARESLAASVAQAYFLAINAHLQVQLFEENVKILTKTVDIVQSRFDNGMSNQKDLSLAKSDLASAKSQLESAKGSKRDAIRALEVLLGSYPAAQLEVRTDLPALPADPPVGVPSEILERRPDLVAAERKVAAAFNYVHQAKAARLPVIGITADASTASTALSNLLNPAGLAWMVAGNLLAPIIDGGARQADVKIETADQEAALAEYGQAALEAFQEVEQSLDRGSVLKKREVLLKEAVKQAAEAYRIVELQYKEGETDLLSVLQIQQRFIGEKANLLEVQGAQLEQRILLHLALGGGWEDAQSTPATTQASTE